MSLYFSIVCVNNLLAEEDKMKKIVMICMCMVGLSMTLAGCESTRKDGSHYSYSDGERSGSADRMFENRQRK